MRDDHPRLIAPASPKGGSGKTTEAILLAGEFATFFPRVGIATYRRRIGGKQQAGAGANARLKRRA